MPDSTNGLAYLFFSLLTGIGALQNISKKILYQMSSVGVDGVLKKFEKPWFIMFTMFISCGCVLLLYLSKLLISYVLSTPEERPKVPKIKLITYFQLIIPTLLDLVASVMINVALIWISVSICQMIRGLGVVFTAIFTVILRKRKLFNYQYAGGAIIILSVIILGMVEVMNDEDDGNKPVNVLQIIFGVFLIIGGQALRALQSIIEEGLLRDVVVPPFFIVGIQGMWGFLMTGILFFPVLYYTPFAEGSGLHENFFDSVAMAQNNSPLLVILVSYAVLSGSGSLSYVLVVNMTDALTADVISLLRNLLVWIIAVTVHYTVDPTYGEGLGLFSLVELLGFLVMVLGIFIFRGILTLGWFSDAPDAPFLSFQNLPKDPTEPVLVDSAEGEFISVSQIGSSSSEAAVDATKAAAVAAAVAVEEALTKEAAELRAEYTEIKEGVEIIASAASAVEPEKLWKSLLLFAVMILLSTLQNVSKKVAFQMSAVGLDGVLKKFEKPWFLVWMMFIAEGCVVLFYLTKSFFGYVFSTPEERLKIPSIKLTTYFQLIFPTLCDLISSVMINLALIWISVSVCQMIRSMGVVFTGIFTILLRKRKLFKFEFFGALIIVLSVVLLGVAEVMDSPETIFRIVLGIFFIVIGQAFHALQSIAEEGLLRDVVVPPFFIVGVQGVWGLILTTVVFFPLLYYLPFEESSGLHEDFFDTIAMLKNNTYIPLLLLCYAILSGCGSLVYLLVMELTNALTADVISLLRNLLVWILAVSVHYIFGAAFGEGLGKRSLVQFLGFIVMFLNIFYKGGISIGWLPNASKVPVAFPMPSSEPFVVDGAAWEDRAAWSSVGDAGEEGDARATTATEATLAAAEAVEEKEERVEEYEEIQEFDTHPAPVLPTSATLAGSTSVASFFASPSASALASASPSTPTSLSASVSVSSFFAPPSSSPSATSPTMLKAARKFFSFISPGDGIAEPESRGEDLHQQYQERTLPPSAVGGDITTTPQSHHIPALVDVVAAATAAAITASPGPGQEPTPGLTSVPSADNISTTPQQTTSPGRGGRRGGHRGGRRGKGWSRRARRGEAPFPGTVSTVTLVKRVFSSANLAVFSSSSDVTPSIWRVEKKERKRGKEKKKEKEKEKGKREGEGETEPLLKQ